MTPAALWTAVAITATAVLSFDLLLPPGVAGGVPYVLLVLLALKSPSRNAAIGLAAAGSVLTVLGFFLSEPGAMLSIVLTNRALALLVIWISVLQVVRYQRIRFAASTPRHPQGLFEKAIHASPHLASLTRTSDRRIIDVNAVWLRVMGRTREEVIGATATELETWEDTARRDELYTAADANGRLREEEAVWRAKDGRLVDVLISVERLDLNDGAATLVIANDETARKKAEKALRESEDRFEKAFQASPLMTTLLWLEDGRRIDANDAWFEGPDIRGTRLSATRRMNFPFGWTATDGWRLINS